MAALPATYWRRQASWTSLRYNLAAVLSEFLPFGFGVSAVFACTLLIVRGSVGAGPGLWGAYVLGLLAGLGVAGWRAWKRFFTVNDALVRLEWHLRLHNRLSAAIAGIGAFPAVQAAADGYIFHWTRIVTPLISAAALVWAAAAIPVSKHAGTYVPTATPVAWAQTAAWVDALKKTDTVQEPALEELQERLEQLRRQPADDWYSQSSLEAGDNLREQTAQSLQSLQRDLRSALGGLEAGEHLNEASSPEEMKAVHDHLAEALKGLELGNLPLNHDLLAGLKQADLANLKTLTAAQIEALKRSLKAGDKVCQACLHPGEMEAKIGLAVKVDKGMPGGKGGGTSHPPLTLNEKPTDLDPGTSESVSNPNLDHAMPGEVLAVGKGDHPVDPTKYAGLAPGGAVASNGQGGEVVERNDLTPKERAVLKDFYR